MIEIKHLDDLERLADMQTERPEKVIFMLGKVESATLVKEIEGDVELACKQCYFAQKRTLCVAVNCSEPESVLFRKIDLEE